MFYAQSTSAVISGRNLDGIGRWRAERNDDDDDIDDNDDL